MVLAHVYLWMKVFAQPLNWCDLPFLYFASRTDKCKIWAISKCRKMNCAETTIDASIKDFFFFLIISFENFSKKLSHREISINFGGIINVNKCKEPFFSYGQRCCISYLLQFTLDLRANWRQQWSTLISVLLNEQTVFLRTLRITISALVRERRRKLFKRKSC